MREIQRFAVLIFSKNQNLPKYFDKCFG